MSVPGGNTLAVRPCCGLTLVEAKGEWVVAISARGAHCVCLLFSSVSYTFCHNGFHVMNLYGLNSHKWDTKLSGMQALSHSTNCRVYKLQKNVMYVSHGNSCSSASNQWVFVNVIGSANHQGTPRATPGPLL